MSELQAWNVDPLKSSSHIAGMAPKGACFLSLQVTSNGKQLSLHEELKILTASPKAQASTSIPLCFSTWHPAVPKTCNQTRLRCLMNSQIFFEIKNALDSVMKSLTIIA